MVPSKILITGASGFVGKNMAEYFAMRGRTILCPDSRELDLLQYNQIDRYLKKNTPNTIIHCAGKVGGIQANIDHPYDFFYQNVVMGANLIECSRKYNIEKLINLASTCIYPCKYTTPLSEDMLLTGKIEPTNEGYALSKISILKMCIYSNQQYKTNYKTILPTNLFGKYDHFFSRKSHLISAIISKIYTAVKNNINEIDVWGTGSAKREFMYVEDLCDFIYNYIGNYNDMPEILNCGTGQDFTIKEYYQKICDLMNFKGNLVFDPSKPEGVPRKSVCINKMLSTGWFPKYTLEKGLEETLKYFNGQVI